MLTEIDWTVALSIVGIGIFLFLPLGLMLGQTLVLRKLRKKGSFRIGNWTYVALDSNDTVIVEMRKSYGLQGKLRSFLVSTTGEN